MTWIFGYGSLLWRPDFEYESKRKSIVRGWRRRFWQASPDHRGVPGAPGRVVTLVAEAGAHCWGVAYRLPSDRFASVLAALDHRERNGYERAAVDIELDDGEVVPGLTYIAGPSNPSFVGPAPLEAMLVQVTSAVGPSGANADYVRQLAASLDVLGVRDEEVEILFAGLAAARPA